jgi:hypothetical protein
MSEKKQNEKQAAPKDEAQPEAKAEEKPAPPPPKQVGCIVFARGVRPKGGMCVTTTNDAALVADAKDQGYLVEVYPNHAEIFAPSKGRRE